MTYFGILNIENRTPSEQQMDFKRKYKVIFGIISPEKFSNASGLYSWAAKKVRKSHLLLDIRIIWLQKFERTINLNVFFVTQKKFSHT